MRACANGADAAEPDVDDLSRAADSAIAQLERELTVRDFISVLNDGSVRELHAFLADDVRYRHATHQTVRGRPAVVAMIDDIKCTFDEWRIAVVHVAVAGDVVLAEQTVTLRLPGCRPHRVTGLASFRLDNFRIADWLQLQA